MVYSRMQTLVGLETMQHHGYDRDILEQLGLVAEFDAMMTPQWAPLLRCSWLQYDELTTHTMSVAQFTVAFGLYTQEQVASADFEDFLTGFTRAARPEILACTLISRHSGKDKVSYFDLFCLYCIQGRHPANLATILLTSFARPRLGGHTTRLDMGPYIGHLAHRLRVFTTYPVEHVTVGPETSPYALYDMQTSGMRIDMMEDIQRLMAAHMSIELPPRMQDHRIPSDPEVDTKTEPEDGEDED
ncbi:hypothetical protein R6Q59_013693 [Mikania micrantha]